MDLFQNAESIRLTVVDEDENRAETSIDRAFEAARDPSGARRQIEKHLFRTGNTLFRVVRLSFSSSNPGFIPPSILNGLRRDVLKALTQIRIEKYPAVQIPFLPNDVPYPEKELDFRANVLNSYARRFYERHGVKAIEPAFETLADPAGRRVMTTRYCIRHQLDMCHREEHLKNLPKEPLQISDGHHVYRLEFDCGKCRMHVILLQS